MGRYYWDKKDTVEDCRSVSIPFLKKHGYFSSYGYRSGTITWTNNWSGDKNSIGIAVYISESEKYARFQYTVTDRNTGEKTEYDYKAQLTTTPCNLGGVRYWFICPLSVDGVYCGRRVAKLYKAPGGSYFGCRHCYNLSYESRNECRLGRLGQLGYVLKADRQYEELHKSIKRWTWRGRPTRKVRRLKAVEQKLNMGLVLCKRFLQ